MLTCLVWVSPLKVREHDDLLLQEVRSMTTWAEAEEDDDGDDLFADDGDDDIRR